MPTTATRPAWGLREQKKRQTHKRIRDAAVSLFVSNGFDGTTVDAIALKAGVSKPTLFNYFPSKAAIVTELIDTMDLRLVGYIDNELAQEKTTRKRLHGFMGHSAADVGKSPELTRMLMVEGFSAIGDADTSRARFALLRQSMAELVRAGRKQGDVRKDYSIDLLVQILMGAYLQALLDWLSDQYRDLSRSFNETARFLSEAVAPADRSPADR